MNTNYRGKIRLNVRKDCEVESSLLLVTFKQKPEEICPMLQKGFVSSVEGQIVSKIPSSYRVLCPFWNLIKMSTPKTPIQ